MSHSQWEKKKYKKAAQSNTISKVYSKLVKAITSEAKKCDGNRESPSLKALIQKARQIDMPNDNIERAIKKATEAGHNFEHITYEAYGPSGAGIVIEALTENRNKASQEIKHILSTHNTSLAGIGSVSWAFKKHIATEGIVWEPEHTVSLSEEDTSLLEALIDELEDNDEVQSVFTNHL